MCIIKMMYIKAPQHLTTAMRPSTLEDAHVGTALKLTLKGKFLFSQHAAVTLELCSMLELIQFCQVQPIPHVMLH